MSDETPFWDRDPIDIAREENCNVITAMYLQADVERDHLRKRLDDMREDLDEALDWVEAGESVLIPMLRMHGVETAPLVHFDMLVSEVHRTGLIERLDNERWRPVDGDEMPEMPEPHTEVRGWVSRGGVRGKERRLRLHPDGWWRDVFGQWRDMDPDEIVEAWRPAAKGPGGEDE